MCYLNTNIIFMKWSFQTDLLKFQRKIIYSQFHEKCWCPPLLHSAMENGFQVFLRPLGLAWIMSSWYCYYCRQVDLTHSIFNIEQVSIILQQELFDNTFLFSPNHYVKFTWRNVWNLNWCLQSCLEFVNLDDAENWSKVGEINHRKLSEMLALLYLNWWINILAMNLTNVSK